MRAWVVRGSRQGAFEDAALSTGRVLLIWEDVPDLSLLVRAAHCEPRTAAATMDRMPQISTPPPAAELDALLATLTAKALDRRGAGTDIPANT